MASETDRMLDRVRLKSQLIQWRMLALFLAVLCVGMLIWKGSHSPNVTSGYIARVAIDNVIIEDHYRIQALEELRDDPKVKAVVVAINSPGGTVVGGESLYRVFKQISQKKPVVAMMGSLATSGGYMVALGADHIVAHQGTITGSIGVLLQTVELEGLSEKLGVEFITLKSGDLKGTPSPFEALDPAARAVLQETIDDSYALFVDMVMQGRSLSKEQVLAVADGRVFTGRQALEVKLVDQLGVEADALAWLKETHQIDIKKFALKEVDTEKYVPNTHKWYRLFESYTQTLPAVKSGGIWAIWNL